MRQLKQRINYHTFSIYKHYTEISFINPQIIKFPSNNPPKLLQKSAFTLSFSSFSLVQSPRHFAIFLISSTLSPVWICSQYGEPGESQAEPKLSRPGRFLCPTEGRELPLCGWQSAELGEMRYSATWTPQRRPYDVCCYQDY